jgi:hypothetical protein
MYKIMLFTVFATTLISVLPSVSCADVLEDRRALAEHKKQREDDQSTRKWVYEFNVKAVRNVKRLVARHHGLIEAGDCESRIYGSDGLVEPQTVSLSAFNPREMYELRYCKLILRDGWACEAFVNIGDPSIYGSCFDAKGNQKDFYPRDN